MGNSRNIQQPHCAVCCICSAARLPCVPACLPSNNPHLHDLPADGLILLPVRQLLPRLHQLALAVLNVLPSLRVVRLKKE